jgi:hypothetical protein
MKAAGRADEAGRLEADSHQLHQRSAGRGGDLGQMKYETEIAQDPARSKRSALLQREGVRSYLEIGSKFGGSLWRVANSLPPGSRIVSVDLPNGTKAWGKAASR